MEYLVRYFLCERGEEEELITQFTTNVCPLIPRKKETVLLGAITLDDRVIRDYDCFEVIGVTYSYLNTNKIMVDVDVMGNYYPE